MLKMIIVNVKDGLNSVDGLKIKSLGKHSSFISHSTFSFETATVVSKWNVVEHNFSYREEQQYKECNK